MRLKTGDRGVQRQVAELVDEIEAQKYGPRGDVLIFCPGERQIRDLAKNPARARSHSDSSALRPLK